MLTLGRVWDNFALERLALAMKLDDCTMECLVPADMELREGSMVLNVELYDSDDDTPLDVLFDRLDDTDFEASDDCDEREKIFWLDVIAVGVGLEDKDVDTNVALLAGLLDDVEFGALAAVLCTRKLEDEEERLDKSDCTDELREEEERISQVF